MMWCGARHPTLRKRRADIECFTRAPRSPRSMPRHDFAKACTVAGFYRYAVEEELLDHSRQCMFAVPVSTMNHMPPAWMGMRSNALLWPLDLGQALEHALISLLALNGLRVSEATGADIEAIGLERGHRTLRSCAKAGGRDDSACSAHRPRRRSPYRRALRRSDLRWR